MLENIEMFNLSQQKEEETIQYQNQIIIPESFSLKNISKRNQKKNKLMNKAFHIGNSILELNKILMYNYVKVK